MTMQSNKIVSVTIKTRNPSIRNSRGSDRSIRKSLKFIAKVLFVKFQKLVSPQRDPNDCLSARKLRLILFRYSSGRLKNITSKEVSLITIHEERGLINSWHEVTYQGILSKIQMAYRELEWRQRLQSQYITIKACDFINVHLCNSYSVIDPGFVNKRAAKLAELHNLYRPLEESVKRKICGHKEEEFEPSCTINDMVLYHTANYKKLRQTKIDEYFSLASKKMKSDGSACGETRIEKENPSTLNKTSSDRRR